MNESISIIKIVAPIILALMMVGMGMSLKFKDFGQIFTKPKAIILGSLLQLILIPLVGIALVKIFNISTDMAIGLIILSACPGGPASNLAAFLCKGDSALSVSLTIVSSIYTVITIPLVVTKLIPLIIIEGNIGEIAENVSTIKMSVAIIVLTLVPTFIGVIVNEIKPQIAKKLIKPFKIASSVLLVLFVVNVFIKDGNIILEHAISVGHTCLLLFIITATLSYVISKVFRLPVNQIRSIALEVGIQNSALAIVVATTFLNNSTATFPAILYSPVMIFIVMILVAITNFMNDPAAEQVEQE